MVVDFHTHTFPDKIAAQSIAFLSEKGGIRAHRAGTLDALKDSMRQNGVDFSVVLPVATKPQQEKSINALSKAENGREGVFFAGGIHPDCEDVEATLDFIKDAGLFGIKLHPDYQGVEFDDPRYLHILEEAARRAPEAAWAISSPALRRACSPRCCTARAMTFLPSAARRRRAATAR